MYVFQAFLCLLNRKVILNQISNDRMIINVVAEKYLDRNESHHLFKVQPEGNNGNNLRSQLCS